MTRMPFTARCIDCGEEFEGAALISNKIPKPAMCHVVFGLLLPRDAANEGILIEGVGDCKKPTTSEPRHAAGFDEITKMGYVFEA